MSKELVFERRKYRYPGIDFDLTCVNRNESIECFEFYSPEGLQFRIPFKDVHKLTNVKEPLKKEEISFCLVYPDKIPAISGLDVVFGLRTISTARSRISGIIEYREALCNDRRFDDAVIVKTCAFSKEMTDEEIEQQLEFERNKDREG